MCTTATTAVVSEQLCWALTMGWYLSLRYLRASVQLARLHMRCAWLYCNRSSTDFSKLAYCAYHDHDLVIGSCFRRSFDQEFRVLSVELSAWL